MQFKKSIFFAAVYILFVLAFLNLNSSFYRALSALAVIFIVVLCFINLYIFCKTEAKNIIRNLNSNENFKQMPIALIKNRLNKMFKHINQNKKKTLLKILNCKNMTKSGTYKIVYDFICRFVENRKSIKSILDCNILKMQNISIQNENLQIVSPVFLNLDKNFCCYKKYKQKNKV